ncbi:Hint domain-containing protein [Roseovarius salinarum]|uniref:Hint domain-containing protein n=1 Tax=Roseovarius salinarum TaxID=1981892 RepID=UPI000C31FC9A|nr:Hint domain-containing protein [Roseovarius salinarum]
MTRSARRPAQSVRVHLADDLTVTDGANLGDALSFADELDLGDTYQLHPNARRERLALLPCEDGHFTLDSDTAQGAPGAAVRVDSCLTLMAATGATIELLVLVELDENGRVAAVYAVPLAPITPRTDYTLVRLDRDSARRRMAEVACVAFTRGTHITLASGRQERIERLSVGDVVLTRDDGPQAIRWIGQSTVRAVGEFAPIRIKAGALCNEHDLVVSPDHRLFIYQRSDAIGAGRKPVLVRARHLVNGATVVQQPGGFVDYFQILFDEHQIIYAEGIAAETLLVDSHTRPALPVEVAGKLAGGLPAHTGRPHLDFEVRETLLNHPDTAALLKRASAR